MKTKDLDRIAELGFVIDIIWNRDMSISYPLDLENDHLVILFYAHPYDSKISFEKSIPSVIEEFNSWYLDNRSLLEEYLMNNDPMLREKLNGFGDISSKIYRDLRIGGIMEDYDF